MGIPLLVISLCLVSSAEGTAKKGDHAQLSALVRVARTKLGPTLVTAQGQTLYLLSADGRAHGTSVCYAACEGAWPPLSTIGAPKAGRGVNASLLGVSRRSDGSEQVTYDGHRLYLFYKDTAAGQTNGEGLKGFGGPFCTAKLAKGPCIWDAVSPSGAALTRTPTK